MRHGVSLPRAGFALLLAAATVAVYLGVLSSEFIRYDDPRYITQNPEVRAGLSAESVRWAFTTFHKSNWHPLAWLSHMLDVELFGLEAGGHHATSLLLHVANALLLFGVLCAATAATAPSALVAALFALHPTHVESVAWVAERKDVLSTFFGLLSLAAYLRFARLGGVWRYALVALCFALSLLAKPMLVTLPFVFLLLDYWPLGRLRLGSGVSRVVEKLPLFALVVVSSVVTIRAQAHGGALGASDLVSLGERFSNAVMSYGLYLWKTIWPANLALLYPHPSLPGGTPWRAWQVGAVAAGLITATAAVLRAHTRPYLAVGWLWYLGTLAPVIGVLQAGPQAMADRYTYVPAVGLYLMLAFGAADFARSRSRWATPLALVAIVWVGLLSAASWRQVGHWRDSISIFSHSVAAAPGALIMHNNLGNALFDLGEVDAAIEQYEIAIEIESGRGFVHRNLARALRRQERVMEAVPHELIAAGIDPESAPGQIAFGAALASTGDADGALARYRRGVELEPDGAEGHARLGMALLASGDADGLEHLRTAARLDASGRNHTNLAHALFRSGSTEEAVEHYRAAVAAAPESPTAFRNLGDALLHSGELEEAIVFYRQGVLLEPDSARARERLEDALQVRTIREQSSQSETGSGGR